MSITVNHKNALCDELLSGMESELLAAHDTLVRGTGAGNDFLGWVRLPERDNDEEVSRIIACAERIRKCASVLIVIGIGGSYLGARAGLEFIRGAYHNELDDMQVYFVGNNMSADHINQIIRAVGERDFAVNVISKSGTTTEPAIAFRIFKRLLEKRYGVSGAKERIIATTDARRGALKSLADAAGYESFVIADDIGGRYSVLTPVGLLPMAIAGIDIKRILCAARDTEKALIGERSLNNPALRYAGVRNALYRQGKKIEILACFEPRFRFMAEWWKQLFGESEGKDNVGIFPASVELSADLHSMGQYIQQGERILFETFVAFDADKSPMTIEMEESDLDGINYLAGRDMSFVNSRALLGTSLAHLDGGVPNMQLDIDGACESTFGELVYFFEFACGISGYMLGVNPFNQPGVEAYKKNMFALLGKPGYEELYEKLLNSQNSH